MATTPAIHLRVHDVGGNFVRLTQALDHSPQYAGQVGSHSVEDEFDRFKIWAGNIAAHRKGRRSLEYRLRDATHLRDEVNGLLTTLEQSLKDAVAIVKGEKTPWDALEDSDDDSNSASDASSDGGEETELKQLLDSIQSSVTCLFRLSMAIRDPASDDRLQRTITVDKSYFEDYDILHAKTKFPDCAEYLSQRLGRAISGRRQYLSYRELHHQKLAKKAELIGLEQPRTEHTTNSTEASPLPVARSNSLNVLDEDDTLSQTSYATSVNATIRVPPLPKQAREHEHFECPLCFMIASIHTKAAWKQHIYRDLHPYSCTIEQCAMEDHLYESRNAWFQHELEAHRSSWQCVPGCDTLHTRECDFEAHVSKRHPDLSSPPMLIALKRTSRRAADITAKTHCPLCGVLMSVKALKKHVGRHQEQLALFALPTNLDDTDGDVEVGDTNSYDAAVNVNEWRDADMSDSDDSESVDSPSVAEPTEPVQSEMMSCLVCHEWWLHNEQHKYCPTCGSKKIAPASVARWTKIDRRLVNPQALEEAREQFEEREDCCVVLRVLTQEEIQKLADRTKEIREAREATDATGEPPNLQNDIQDLTQTIDLLDATPKDAVPDMRAEGDTIVKEHKELSFSRIDRIDRPYNCDVSGCHRASQGRGFATLGDLQRHKKSVHRIGVSQDSYQCASEHCRNRGKTWPRLDNFKQHISRMHKDEDEDELIRNSAYRGPIAPSLTTQADMLAAIGVEAQVSSYEFDDHASVIEPTPASHAHAHAKFINSATVSKSAETFTEVDPTTVNHVSESPPETHENVDRSSRNVSRQVTTADSATDLTEIIEQQVSDTKTEEPPFESVANDSQLRPAKAVSPAVEAARSVDGDAIRSTHSHTVVEPSESGRARRQSEGKFARPLFTVDHDGDIEVTSSSKRGSLYEQDLASQRHSAKKYNVEVREPSERDHREHRNTAPTFGHETEDVKDDDTGSGDPVGDPESGDFNTPVGTSTLADNDTKHSLSTASVRVRKSDTRQGVIRCGGPGIDHGGYYQ